MVVVVVRLALASFAGGLRTLFSWWWKPLLPFLLVVVVIFCMTIIALFFCTKCDFAFKKNMKGQLGGSDTKK